MSGLWGDVRHGARVFAKHPGFTAIAVISIAFGTGANVAMFSLADALLLRPLPVPRPGELVTVGTRIKRGIATLNVASYPDYVDIRERASELRRPDRGHVRHGSLQHRSRGPLRT